MNKNKLPCIIAILAALIAIVSFFLPYVSATNEFRTYINSYADEKIYSSVDLTAGDMADMSLFTYARIYFVGGEEILRSKDNGIIYGVLMSSVAGFALLIILAALWNRPVLLMILDSLMAGAFYLINWDFLDRGIMPDARRVWGISHEVYYPIAVVIAVCAIWMLAVKRKGQNDQSTSSGTVK